MTGRSLRSRGSWEAGSPPTARPRRRRRTSRTPSALPQRSKAEAVAFATADLLTYLHASGNSRNFALGYGSFNNTVTQDRPVTAVADVDASAGFDPTAAGTGGTCIWTGVEAA